MSTGHGTCWLAAAGFDACQAGVTPFATMRAPDGTPPPIEAGPLLAERQAEREAALADAGVAASIPAPTLPLDGTPWEPEPATGQHRYWALIWVAFIAAMVMASCITRRIGA